MAGAGPAVAGGISAVANADPAVAGGIPAVGNADPAVAGGIPAVASADPAAAGGDVWLNTRMLHPVLLLGKLSSTGVL